MAQKLINIEKVCNERLKWFEKVKYFLKDQIIRCTPF